MRKLFILSFFFFSILTTQAQLLQGLDAAKLFTNSDEVLLDNAGKKVKYIHFNSQSTLSLEYFNFWAADNLGLKGNNSLVQIGMETDALGMVHYRYQQYFNGKPVQYSMLIVHTLKGRVESVNGEYYPGLSDDFQPNFNESEALQKALNTIKASVYAWQDILQESIIKYIDNDASSTYYPKGELVYISKNNSLKNEDFRLAYKFNVYACEPLSRSNIFVDASNGAILFTENLIHTSNVIGTAHTRYSGVRSITTDSTGPGNYRLRETGRGLGVETYNFKRGTSTSASVDFTDTDDDWNNIDTLKDEVATDAHWGAEKTYDYFKTTYNRNSINNNGLKLLSYVHYSNNYNNAFWNGQYMTYGDGNGTLFTPLTALDVCGHEITHGLTSNTANLVYQDEPGGLNESFSDIFGTTIEFYARNGAGNWKIGEDMTPGGAGIRSMQNPKLFNDPNTYFGSNWVNAGGGDNGGVHTNSGVQNYWYYLMCQGGSGTNDNSKAYNVPGMGMLKAAAITFRSLTIYLTPNTQFADARFYSILATKDLYGPCSPEVKITKNTWAAVGVGNDFDTIVKASFMSNDTLICGNSGTVKFMNTSSFDATDSWDFGDGLKSTQANPSHFYASPGNYTVKLKVGSCTSPVKYDSVTMVAYIKVSTTNPYCLAQKMPSDTATGTTITLCSGKLMDDGGINNYSDQTNSKRTISPTGAGFLKLKFNSFNLEENYDYLYIYDGPTKASPLIGKYTGASLPNGGTIITSQGSVTFVQSTDQAVNESGFDIDWQCYPKSSSDIAVIKILPIKSFRQNTPLFTASSTVAAVIKNVGTVAQSNIPLSYNFNGGLAVAGVSTSLLLPNQVDTFIFPTPIANNIGTYQVKAFSTLSTDTLALNDTAYTTFRIIENDPVTLPFTEGFEGMGNDGSNIYAFSLIGAGKFDYDNNDTLHFCRYRNHPVNITPHGGSKVITFDRNIIQSIDTSFSNFLILTLNLTNYITQKKVYFEFYYKSHADEANSNDKVWIRGSMNDNWIEVYNLIPNDTVKKGIFFYVNLRLDSLLNAHGQALSTNTQIRWGQQDNLAALNDNGDDGISFDDIRVYTPSTVGISSIPTRSDEPLIIFPNPAKNEFTISGIISPVKITLMDVTGKVLSVTETDKNASINSRFLAKGIYLLNISSSQMNVTKKLIIE
jgi:bacillolysin